MVRDFGGSDNPQIAQIAQITLNKTKPQKGTRSTNEIKTGCEVFIQTDTESELFF